MAENLPGLSAEQATALRGLTLADVRRRLSRGTLTLPAISAAYARHPPAKKLPRRALKAVRDRIRRAHPDHRFELVGSYRRGKEHPRDLDVLTDMQLSRVNLEAMGEPLEIYANGPSKISMILKVVHGGKPLRIPVDIFHAQRRSWGTAMLHHTGPYEYNIQLRVHARARGYKLNQYSVSKITGKPPTEWFFRTEKAVGRFLKKEIPAPELRA